MALTKLTDLVVLHIHSQNAGILVRRLSEYCIFEAFELSPITDAVTHTLGRLWRVFPSTSIKVKEDRVHNPNFQDAFVQCICQLDMQEIKEACPTTRKAK